MATVNDNNNSSEEIIQDATLEVADHFNVKKESNDFAYIKDRVRETYKEDPETFNGTEGLLAISTIAAITKEERINEDLRKAAVKSNNSESRLSSRSASFIEDNQEASNKISRSTLQKKPPVNLVKSDEYSENIRSQAIGGNINFALPVTKNSQSVPKETAQSPLERRKLYSNKIKDQTFETPKKTDFKPTRGSAMDLLIRRMEGQVGKEITKQILEKVKREETDLIKQNDIVTNVASKMGVISFPSQQEEFLTRNQKLDAADIRNKADKVFNAKYKENGKETTLQVAIDNKPLSK